MSHNPWFVYITRTITGRFYTGITTEPIKRLDAHNKGKGSKLAIDQGPFELVYTSKPFIDKSQARKREAQVKGWSKQKKLKLINGEWI